MCLLGKLKLDLIVSFLIFCLGGTTGTASDGKINRL
jgi:hypothetical protein